MLRAASPQLIPFEMGEAKKKKKNAIAFVRSRHNRIRCCIQFTKRRVEPSFFIGFYSLLSPLSLALSLVLLRGNRHIASGECDYSRIVCTVQRIRYAE